jgi:hypothetical protein
VNQSLDQNIEDKILSSGIHTGALLRCLLKSLLNLDMRMTSSKKGKYAPVDKLLSKESKALVTSMNKLWNLSECSKICGLLNAIFEEYKADKLVIEVLLDSYGFMREKMKDFNWTSREDVS